MWDDSGYSLDGHFYHFDTETCQACGRTKSEIDKEQYGYRRTMVEDMIEGLLASLR